MTRWMRPGMRLLAALLVGLLSACSGAPFDFLNPPASPTATALPLKTTATPTPEATRAVTATPSGPQPLVLWLPPQFDPASGTPAGDLLKARLESFQTANPGIRLQVRIKASSGNGGLLESLSVTSAAAPSALPGLIALPRSDLETAALKGLIFPLDGLSKQIDDPDWYAFARQLALIQGSAFGLPFAGDTLLLLYRSARLPTAPTDWNSIVRLGQTVAFPAADPQALVTLELYLSAGGATKDAQGRPILQAEALLKTLKLFGDGEKQSTFPNWLAQYQTDGQAWQAYRDQRANLAITWCSRYLSELPVDTSATLLPSLGAQPLTLATGWVWAISEPIPEHRQAAAKLAEFLVTSDFLSQWNAAAGYLPPRPSALAAWTNQSMRSLLSAAALSAQVRPSNDALISLGPVLSEATLQVIKQQSDPVQASQSAVEKLTLPATK